MALTDDNGFNTTMLVSPTSSCGGNGGSGFGNGFGFDGWWIILLLLFAGGWGNNNGGFGAGNGGMTPAYYGGGYSDVQRGFDQSAVMGAVNSVQAGVQGLATQLCSCCADAENSANARQMANMQQMFNLSTQLSDCCCENRLGLANLNATIVSENCADREAIASGVREIITNQTANTQKILDRMCSDKIDAKNEKIAELQNQLNMASLRESQTAQNAFIQNGFNNGIDALYTRLSNCPVPSMPVYGNTPIFTCAQSHSTCGCGCNG